MTYFDLLRSEVFLQLATRPQSLRQQLAALPPSVVSEQPNYEAWVSDTAVPAMTVREYFSVLEDTLIGEMLEPWNHGNKRKAVSAGKFYFFDLGVRDALAGASTAALGSGNLRPGSPSFPRYAMESGSG